MRFSRAGRGIIAAMAITGVALACGDSGTEPDTPVPGELTVQLTTPTDSEGAVVLTVTGPGLSAVSAAGSAASAHINVSGTTARIAVFGQIQNGPVARLAVPDTRAVSSYKASVTEVADRANALRSGLTGYTVKLTR